MRDISVKADKTVPDDTALKLPSFIRRRFRSLVSSSGADETHLVRLEQDDKAVDAVVEAFDFVVNGGSNTDAFVVTFANMSPGLARSLVDWRLGLLRSTHRAMNPRIDWFGPDEVDLRHRFPWPTARIRLALAGATSDVILRVHTCTGGSVVVWPTGFVPSDADPARSCDFLAELTGHPIEPLRVANAYEFEFAEQGASHELDGPRSPWQQPGWTRRLVEEVRREVGPLGISLTGEFRIVRHSSVTSLCTVPSSAGLLWIKIGHPVFTSEASFLLRAPASARRELPTVVALGEGWFAMTDFVQARPRPANVVKTVLRLQSEFDAALAIGDPALHELLSRPLDRVQAVVHDLDSLQWVPRQVQLTLQDRLDELMAALSDRAQSPTTVTHGDLNAANIAAVGNGYVIHDWTDVALAPAGVDLLTLDRSMRDPRVSAAVDDALASFGDSVARARLVAAVTADAFQLVNYDTIIRGVDQTAADHSSGTSMQSHFLRAASRLAFRPKLL